MATATELLGKLRSSRAGVLRRLAHVREDQMTVPVPWRNTKVDARFMLYRLVEHELEHTVHLVKVLNALGVVPSEAQLILRELEAARGRLEGLLVGLPDEVLDRKPADGQWSPREVLEHIVTGEEGYARRLEDALQAAAAPAPGAPR